MNRNLKSLVALFLLTGVMAAPAAGAAEAVNRNTGVGQQIAAQGNAALVYIRTTLRLVAPKLPKQARPRAMKMFAPSVLPSGGGTLDTAGLRCAE